MRFMLDTDICSVLIRGESPKLDARLRAFTPAELCISAITHAELLYGLAKRPKATKLASAVRALIARLQSVAWDGNAAARYADIRSALEKKGSIIGGMDMLIAAHAVSLGLPLVTNNVREFRRVPDLVLENWI
jgi:tRNA(fMet)-specific endonuclease VapC